MTTPPLLYGKYQLLTRLARGSLGEVWKARSHGVEGFEKILVIKRISRELSERPEFVERFISEVKTAVLLTHANLVHVFDLGHVEGMYFLAMEYVRGPDLGAVLALARKKGKAIPEALAIYLVSELAKGLDYAHRRRDAELLPLGVVHRSVAPENVLLSYEGEVKLSDFGMARARASVWPLADLPTEKMAYLSPEQVREEPLDGRTDVYALGVILHEALTGQRIMTKDASRGGVYELLEQKRRGQRFFASARHAGLSAIIERATAPAREQRHESAGELYEELIGILYESGRRVGALELARFLEELGTAQELEASQDVLGPFSGIEEIFAEAPSTAHPPPKAPEKPRGPVLLVVDEPEARELSLRAEWRDVSGIVIDGREPGEFEALAARYGGEVTRIGEHPLVLFGRLEGSGRDAHAAARCALRIAKACGPDRVRLVVHSGSVLLDASARIAKHPTNDAFESEARRWLRRARKGELLATAAAAALLRDRFELVGDQGEGARVVSRELAPGEGVAKFVGRRNELRAIGEVFARANRGEFSVLGIRGEAGMGKSRLVLEIERRLRNAGHDVGIYLAACSPEAQTIPFFALQELVRSVLGLEDLDAPAKAQEQLDRLKLLGLSSAQREAFAQLLGVGAKEASSSKLETALMRVAYKLAQDRLTVFVWDAAEFMDRPSAELLSKLLSAPFSGRVLAVFAYRRKNQQPWARVPNFNEVTLGPLAEEDVARLARNRLGATEVKADLVRELALRTGGNPLFVEELVTAMREAAAVQVEQGVAQLVKPDASLTLPRSLRGLVASRVGKLSIAERVILQLAVTFGPRFSPELIAHAAELDEPTVNRALEELRDREIVRQVGVSEYGFAHDLVREVLYSAISLEERPSLHAAVARALETLLPSEVEVAAERLAFHYREAGDWEAAVRYLTRAGERLEAEHALDAAIATYEQALELAARGVKPDRERTLALHARIGELAYHTRTSEQVADRMGAALELAESLGAEEYVARFAMLRGRLLNKASRFREGRLWLERAHTVAQRLGHGGLERDIALAAGEAHARNGEYRSVVRYVEGALALAAAAGDVDAEARALLVLIPAHAALGDLAQASAALERLQSVLSDDAERPVQVELERARAAVLEAEGDLGGARDAARRALELAKEFDLPHELALAANQLGGLCLRSRLDKRAFAALRLSYELASEHGYTRLSWRNVCMMGYLDAMRFDSEQAYVRMQQAVEFAQHRGYVVDLIEDKYLLAMVEQKRGALERAGVLLREVIELADAHGHARACDHAERALRALEEGRGIELPR